MLSSISVDIQNNIAYGCVDIVITPTSNNISVPLTLVVKHKEGNGTAVSIFEKEYTTASSLNVTLRDILTIPQKEYEYTINVMRSNAISETDTIAAGVCELEGLFVGDFEGQYIAQSNYNTTYKRNRDVAYVTTLSSRTPYRVSNSALNYTNGSSSGLFLELTQDGKRFERDLDSSFTTRVIDFLTDGNDKILKTHDGHIWYVSIDDTVSPEDSGYWGANNIAFTWTEIGDVPTSGIAEVGDS